MGNLTKRIQETIESSKNNFTEDPPFPKRNMLLEVTNICNDRCIFCVNPRMTRKRRNMDLDFGLRILREAYENGMREVGFYATGEPLINPDICKYVSEAKKIGYEYTYITTNGALLTHKLAEELLDAGLDSIKFSINAGTKEGYRMIHGKDDFELVIEHLKYISRLRTERQKKINIFVSFVVTNKTQNETELLKREIEEYVDEIFFYPVSYFGMMNDVIEELRIDKEPEIKSVEWPCRYLFNNVMISCEGYLTACCSDFQNYLAIEDLNEVPLIDAWHSERFIEFRRNHLKHDYQQSICSNCLSGGCDPSKPLNEKLATFFTDI